MSSIKETSFQKSAAFVLAGGKSLRMGSDKGLMDFNGKPMIAHVLEVVQDLFSDIHIISNNSEYQQFGWPVMEDHVKGIGPIGGLLTGLQFAQTEWSFFIACDLPFIQTTVINLLKEENFNGNVIVPVYNKRIEPLCAFYHKNCISKIQQQMHIGNYKLTDLILTLNAKLVEIPLSDMNSHKLFDNMNSREDILKSFKA